MKCPNCAAETQGAFCEYCGSELPKDQVNVCVCPKCGNNRISFKRERVGTTTQRTSRKKVFGTGRTGQYVSQTTYRTVGLCQNCGHTWSPDDKTNRPKSKAWLWILGWICIFPIPLTILMLRKKDMKPAVKYGIIAAAWAIFFLIGMTGNTDSTAQPPEAPGYSEAGQTETTGTTEATKLVFDLVAGQQGDYGKMITYNKGTEFEENFYAFYIPAGTYKVTNVGEYMSQLNVYPNEIVKTENGWEGHADGGFAKLLDINCSAIVTIAEDQHIEIAEPSRFQFEQQ